MLTNNGEQLRRIAEANSRETLAMTDLAKWTNRDSRTMRIATTIGLMYLPLNLVLVCLSSLLPPPATKTYRILMLFIELLQHGFRRV